MNHIENCIQSVNGIIEKGYDAVGKYLDKNPSVYKVVLVACHFFRTASMYGLIAWAPIPVPITMGVMVVGSLLYRASVERFCCFRFALPSLVGTAAIWTLKAAIATAIAGAAISLFAKAALISFGVLSVVGYVGWVCYISHKDIENRMQNSASRSIKQASSCCNS